MVNLRRHLIWTAAITAMALLCLAGTAFSSGMTEPQDATDDVRMTGP